jgi:hypothetical protein
MLENRVKVAVQSAVEDLKDDGEDADRITPSGRTLHTDPIR